MEPGPMTSGTDTMTIDELISGAEDKVREAPTLDDPEDRREATQQSIGYALVESPS